jgi:predicted PurR-regulated permease PerM
VLYGQVLTAVVQGSVATLGFIIFGLSNWAFWGAVTIVMAFLPVIGTPIIWVPAAVGMILDGNYGAGIGLLVYGIVVIINIDNLVRPKLVSDRSKVHPVLVIIGVLGGLKMVGFSGMLVGPLILALLVALVKFFEDVYLKDTQLAA